MATQVSYSELSTWLSSQPDNTPSTPYELTVTDIPASAGRLRTILKANSTKYVDLSTTVQPKLYRDDFNGCTTLIKSPSFLSSNNAYLTSCFQGCSNLVEVQPLPDSVQWVNYCFSGCTSLTTIHSLPSSLVNMNRCFVGCTSLTTAPAIPNTVENMDTCFSRCTSLTTVQNLPSSATTMASCFYGCTSLVTVPDLPNSVTNVKSCFRDCSSLVTAPVISNSATDMEELFYNCTSLTTVSNISSSATTLKNCFYNCTSLETVPAIPNSVIDMSNTFYGCNSLVTVPNFPNNLENLTSCFFNCTDLTSVPQIPNSVTSMSSCFYNCSSLTTIQNIPNSITNMYHCFSRCSSLTTVPNIPNTVTSMTSCFSDCTALTAIDFEQGGVISVWMQNCFGNCTSLTTVAHLPSKISSMESCFGGCTQLTSLPQIPNTVTNLKQTFSSCSALTTISFEDKIDVSDLTFCFNNCNSLQTIQNMPLSISDMSSNFSIPSSVTYISFSTGVVRVSDIRFLWFKINLVTAVNVPVIANMTNVFYGCTSLETVSFRQVDPSISADMSECFLNCNSLTTIQNFPTNISNMYKCFYSCTSLVTAPRIPDSVTSLEQTFYADTALTTVPNLPSSVTNMQSCFSGCTALETVPPIPSVVTNIAACFSGCTSLVTAPYIPNSVINMENCFHNCTSLETVTNLPSSVTNLFQCFANCTSLTTVNDFQVSKDTLENNAQNCFYNCSALTKIVVRYNETTDWHVFRLDFGSTDVSGKVYDKNGTAVAIPTTTITKSKLVMPVLSDELLFTDTISDADLDDLIADILEYKYTYTTKEAIDPTRKSLVLWADNPDNVITNLSFPADVSHASGVLPVVNGGTGRTTAPNIQVNLASNSSVSELPASGDVAPGVTGTLPVANGGIGRTTAPNIQVNLASTSSVSALPASGNVAPGVTGTLPVANGGTGQTDLNNVTVGKALNGVWGRLGGANLSSKSTFTALITEELTGSNFGGGICGGSINTSAADKGIPAGWYNYLYVPHRTGIGGGDNYKFGTLYVTPMTSNSDNLYIIHYYSGAVQNAKVFKADGTGIATAVKDSDNGTNTTFAYSKAGLTGNPNWLAAWNGYELRAIAPSQVTSGSSSNLNGTVQKAVKYWTQLDLSSLDASKWFPVTVYLGTAGFTEIECYVSLDSGTKPSWSSHNNGFTCHLHLLVMGSGWGTTSAQTLVLDRQYAHTTVNGVTVIPTGWTQMTNSSTGVLWLRGGGKYRVWNNKGETFTIRTSSYTSQSQTVSPTTSYQWSFSYAQLVGTISNANFASQADYTQGTALCTTAAGTAAKVASMRGYVQTIGCFPITFTETNTAASELTLNVNGQGAKAIYINGSASSSTNYTLPAGTYLCYYGGSSYYIELLYPIYMARNSTYLAGYAGLGWLQSISSETLKYDSVRGSQQNSSTATWAGWRTFKSGLKIAWGHYRTSDSNPVTLPVTYTSTETYSVAVSFMLDSSSKPNYEEFLKPYSTTQIKHTGGNYEQRWITIGY